MRRWLALGLVGLALAVGIPTTWWATRPGPAGMPVDAAPGPVPATAAAVPSTRPARAAVTVRADRPNERLSLRVPSLGIVAPIVPVGVRPDGTMDIPEPVREVGWYKFGPAPGTPVGSAVLAGHVDSARQGRGALFDLRTVAVGARIDVTSAAGRTIHYRVTGRQRFVKQRLPTERLFTRDGAARLVIITCGGPFIEKLSSYRDNLVVAASPLS
ncbi:MAG TPA: class F sortase [Kineosporiaceae bacterium]|nr:class F sortase [Kineosporiaceae bacterium]